MDRNVMSSSKLSYKELEQQLATAEEKVSRLTSTNEKLSVIVARYENTIRHISDFIFVHDLKGNFLETEISQEKFNVKNFGYTPNEISGKNVIEFIPEEYRQQFPDYLQRVLKNGNDEGSMAFRTKNNGKRYIWYSNSLMEDSGQQIIRGIARDITDILITKRMIKRSEKLLSQVVEGNSIPTFAIDENREIIFWNHASELLTGIQSKDIVGTTNQWKAFYEKKQRTLADLVADESALTDIQSLFGQKISPALTIPGAYQCEKYFASIGKNKGKWLFLTAAPLINDNGKIIGAIETIQDITERKNAEHELEKAHKELEKKVMKRTQSLEETNTALKVLLKKRDDDKKELEEKMLFNVRELVMPYVSKLVESNLKERQQIYVEIIKSNLNEIITPFIHRMSFEMLKLTPAEIQVANLIKQGKSSKIIADVLNLSPRTIDFHRDNIRKKFDLNNKKVNLRTYLLSNEQTL